MCISMRGPRKFCKRGFNVFLSLFLFYLMREKLRFAGGPMLAQH